MILAHIAPSIHASAASLAMFFQDAAAGGADTSFSITGLWNNMGYFAKTVVIILFIMSIWSLAVIIDRALYFSAARKQSITA